MNYLSITKKIPLAMRVTLILLCLIVFQLQAEDVYSQKTKISLDMKNTTIEKVLQTIEEKSDYYFLYNNKLVNVDRKVSVRVKNAAISDVLDKLFASQYVEYQVEGNQIILSPKEKAKEIVSLVEGVQQQQKTITGKVTDSSGEPLPGATVMVKNTTIGTITDADGNYSLSNVSNDATLVFSFVGMETQEINVGNRTRIDVTLQEESVALEEVVAVGYGTTSRKNLTTSISKVSTEGITKAAISNMPQLLLGRAAGLQATMASAQPGGKVNMSIRGAGDPIYVVDGVVMPNNSLESGGGGAVTVIPSGINRSGLGGLNPEDIESIEILKDASASIYGIGAANGVILITTKKGKEGALKVSYDGSYSVVENYKYPEPLNAQEYMGLVNVFNKEQYLYNNKMIPYGPNQYDNKWNAPFVDSQIANAQTTNWLDVVLRSGNISNHNITINGGNNVVSYYASGNYFNQGGSVSHSTMERYALHTNVILQLNSFIKLTSTANVNRNTYNNPLVGGTSQGRGAQAAGALTAALTYPPYIPVKDENGNYSTFLTVPNARGLEDIMDNTSTKGTYLNFIADFDIIKNMLMVKLLYGNNSEDTRRSVFIPSYVYFDQMFKSRGNLGEDNRENQTLEATITFMKNFGDILVMDGVVGIGKYINSGNGLNVAYDEQHDAIANDNLSSVTGVRSPGSYRYQDEKRSQFIRANFDILDRYVIGTTLRRDGTDKFFPEKKYALFPSISFAWKISNESFLKSVSWLDLLKVRGSYGETGSDNLGTTLYGTFGPHGNLIMFNNNTVRYVPIVQNGLDYPDVSWEKTTMKNLGIDFYCFKNRFWGSFDIFRNDITDMLGTANTAGLSMFGSRPINGAHLRREGWDATFNSKNIQIPAFTWETLLTLSKYNAIWIERMPNYDYNEYEKRDRAPVYARYYYETKGIINAEMSNVPSSQPEAARIPGYPIIVDQNRDGSITVDDVVMSNEVPDIYFGFGNTFSYKNFDLDIFMYSQLGVHKYNYALDWASANNLANQNSNSNIYAFRIWNSQTNPNGTLPGIAWDVASVSLPGGAGTDVRYQNASFLRVRNITLGYNMKGNQLGDVGKYVSNVRIYIDAQNPLTFTNFEGFDPEVYSGGNYKGGKAEYPQIRTFSAGIKINF